MMMQMMMTDVKLDILVEKLEDTQILASSFKVIPQ